MTIRVLSGRLLLGLALLGAWLVGSTELLAQPARIDPARDTALLSAVLRALPIQPYHRVEVEPHLLQADPAMVFPHLDDLAPVSDETVRIRRAHIERSGFAALSEFELLHCGRGPGGLQRADAPSQPDAPRPFCILLALPREGGAYFPPGAIDGRSRAPAGAVTTRVFTISPGGQFHYDVVAVRCPERGWRIVETVRVFSMWS